MATESTSQENPSDTLYAEGLELVFARNEFYRTAHHRVMITLLVSLIFNIAMGNIVYWLGTEKIPPVYFPTDPEGKLLTELPLHEPIFTDAEIKAFAVHAARAVTSYDYLNYRGSLQDARKYFTDAGFDKYIIALNASRNLQTVLDQKLVTRGELEGNITINSSQIGGRHVWFVDIPMNVRYQNRSLTIVQPLIFHLLIGRVPTTVSLSAKQVAQVWIEDRQGNPSLQEEVERHAS